MEGSSNESNSKFPPPPAFLLLLFLLYDLGYLADFSTCTIEIPIVTSIVEDQILTTQLCALNYDKLLSKCL